MKKIIDGKLYNTETANEIGSWRNGYNYCDFQWCGETLYKTKRGKYFLFGEGGPMSMYRKMCGKNSWSGSWDIITQSDADAIFWAEEHLTADEFIDEFKTSSKQYSGIYY